MYEQCTYGTFTFDYHRLKVNEKTLYGQNGMDQIGIEYTFTIEGVLSATNDGDFQTLLRTANCILHQPRLSFRSQWSTDAGGPWTDYFFVDADDDIGWGPKPQELNINTIIGGRSALFTWSLVARVKQCFSSSCEAFSRPSNVLSISRSYNHYVDENGLTTRTVSGKILIHAASIRNQRQQADFYRNLTCLAIPNYFHRISENFQANDDGTEVDFTYTDRERLWTLPKPITSGHATWRVTTSKFGSMVSFMLSGKFTATAATTKTEILRQISLLAANRFPAPGQNGIAYASTERMVEEDVYDNSVTFQISAEAAGGDVGSSGGSGPQAWNAQSVYNTFGSAPPGHEGSENGVAQPIGVYGGNGDITSGVIANVPTPYDSCDPPFSTGGGGSPGSSTQIGVASPGKITVGSTSPTSGAPNTAATIYNPSNLNISQAHMDAPFVEYYEEISYEIDNHILIFYPKTKGSKPIQQQTQNPSMKIIQCGYACRYGLNSKTAPRYPSPVFPDAIIQRPSLTPAVPVATGNNGWNRYKIAWRYVMEFPDVVTDTSLTELTFPLDVRRPATKAEPIIGLNDLKLIPA